MTRMAPLEFSLRIAVTMIPMPVSCHFRVVFRSSISVPIPSFPFNVRLSYLFLCFPPSRLSVGRWVARCIPGVTANAGEDFEEQSGTLSFAAGETTKEIRIRIIDDDEPEEDEMFIVKLANPRPVGRLGPEALTIVTIIDDDCACGGCSASWASSKMIDRATRGRCYRRRNGEKGAESVVTWTDGRSEG